MPKILIPILLLLLMLYGCSQISEQSEPTCTFRPIEKAAVPQDFFTDNFDRNSLQQAVMTSIKYLNDQKQDREITACGQPYTLKDQLTSLQLFNKIIQTSPPKQLSQKIYDNFDFCLAQNSSNQDNILITGYFQPRLQGSITRQPPFIYPIYSLPADLVSALRYSANLQPSSIIGRITDDRLVPYWSRSEIEEKNLLKGYEILYLSNPIDAFSLHIQGSGLVKVTDGRILQVHYAGSNGRPYKSIGKLLADEGKIPIAEVTMPKIRQYLNEHLDDLQRILHYNDRYIFFSVSEDGAEEPVGAMGEELIPGRSVALDNKCFEQGGLYFLKTTTAPPPQDTEDQPPPSSRFVLHHDTGAAIKGSGRLDLYLGSGDAAGKTAGILKNPALLYVLIKKQR